MCVSPREQCLGFGDEAMAGIGTGVFWSKYPRALVVNSDGVQVLGCNQGRAELRGLHHMSASALSQLSN